MLVLFTASAIEQTGVINIRVVDPEERVLKGTGITIEDPAHKLRYTTITDSEGTATVKLSSPGVFDISVAAQGFADYLERAVGSNPIASWICISSWRQNYVRRPSMLSDQNINSDVGTMVLGAFASYKWDLSDRLRLTAGIRVDHTRMEAHASDANAALYRACNGIVRTTNSDTAPAGNVVLTLAGSQSWQWFAGVGSTTRFPDAHERYLPRRKLGRTVFVFRCAEVESHRRPAR